MHKFLHRRPILTSHFTLAVFGDIGHRFDVQKVVSGLGLEELWTDERDSAALLVEVHAGRQLDGTGEDFGVSGLQVLVAEDWILHRIEHRRRRTRVEVVVDVVVDVEGPTSGRLVTRLSAAAQPDRLLLQQSHLDCWRIGTRL